MFLAAWIGDVPLLGVSASGLYHRTTVLDLVLPRILAGKRIGMKTFGASAPLKVLQKEFGFTKESVVAAVKKQLAKVR